MRPFDVLRMPEATASQHFGKPQKASLSPSIF
jgi:hypothetical protein